MKEVTLHANKRRIEHGRCKYFNFTYWLARLSYCLLCVLSLVYDQPVKGVSQGDRNEHRRCERIAYAGKEPEHRANTGKDRGMTTQEIFEYLTAASGSEFFAAALMGNFYAESGIRSNNLQNVYEKKLGLTDALYTEAVDKGSYTRDQFTYDSAGYGFAQWTWYSRKRGLYDFWKKTMAPSISDPKMQLDYAIKEFKEVYKSIWEKRGLWSIDELTIEILVKYEAPASKDDPAVQKKRCTYAHNIFKECHKEDPEPDRKKEILQELVELESFIKDIEGSLEDVKSLIDDLFTEVEQL